MRQFHVAGADRFHGVVQIVLLLLSQDDGLARTVYKVRLQKVPWYSDRAVLDISLGDLMLIVLMKSAFRNATATQDEYVHTNSMSTMINLVPQAVKLSPLSTQRLCSCIEGSHKRLLWLDQKACCVFLKLQSLFRTLMLSACAHLCSCMEGIGSCFSVQVNVGLQ